MIPRICFLLVYIVCLHHRVSAQIMYAEGYLYGPPERYILKIDLNTCEVCAVKPELVTNNAIADFTVLPDGSQLHYNGYPGITRETPPPASGIMWGGGGGILFSDGVLAPNGLVYVTGPESGLYTFNPATNALTFVGSWPAGGGCWGLYYMNGVLHGSWYPVAGGNHFDIIVNVSNPAASTFATPNPTYLDHPRELTWNGVNGIAYLNTTGAGTIYFQDSPSGTATPICSFSPPVEIFVISTNPPNLPEYPCVDPCVTTHAGNFTSMGPYTGCNMVLFPQVANTMINSTEVVNYILYTDPNDPLGSLITTSTGSYFPYNPAQTTPGVTYYGAAIAGNNSGNGVVNLSDPCLDISDSIYIMFKVRPSVSFSASLTDICPGGCQSIVANFTGDPPFTVAGNIISAGNVVGTFNQSFATSPGTFQVCIPSGIPTGAIEIEATSITDATCSCN